MIMKLCIRWDHKILQLTHYHDNLKIAPLVPFHKPFGMVYISDIKRAYQDDDELMSLITRLTTGKEQVSLSMMGYKDTRTV